MSNTRKFFVIDTNVLIHDPTSIFAFQDNNVVIPYVVIEELDDLKTKQGIVGKHARDVSKLLDAIRSKSTLSDWVDVENGIKLKVEMNHVGVPESLNNPDYLHKNDNRILSVAYNYQKEGNVVVLVSKDLNLRLKSDLLGIPAQDFEKDKVDFKHLYSGITEIPVPYKDMVDEIHSHGSIDMAEMYNFVDASALIPNQFAIIRCDKQSALCRFTQDKFVKIKDQDAFGIKALNKEQKFALNLLLDDSVKIVTLIGKAGTGKTLIAIAAGLEKVLEKNKYRKVLVMRPVVTTDDGIGYLPGTKEEKLRPFMAPVYDNLDFIFDGAEQKSETVEHLFERGTIEVEALSYVRGRSLSRSFIVVDEAQNMTPAMIKTVLTRVGKGTKIIFTGDPEQIDTPYLDEESNGLSYLVEQIKNEKLSGHITLVKGERSDVAEIGAKLS